MSTRQHEAVVLGATGYVGAEVLRLIAGHPNLKLGAAVARSAVGKAIGDDWPHLRGAYAGVQYQALDAVPLEGDGVLAVFSCLPHGAGATQLDEWLGALEGAGRSYRVVDLAADFRLPGPADWLSVYGEPHGAPGRYPQFACALPDLTPGQPSELMAHPGCFTTATTLGAAPLCEGGLIEPGLFVSAITGSTGSGREAKAGTHHPDRHGNLSAYNPLRHRHAPEMEMLLGRLGGVQPEVSFVPHSGPFARGIHATLRTLARTARRRRAARHVPRVLRREPLRRDLGRAAEAEGSRRQQPLPHRHRGARPRGRGVLGDRQSDQGHRRWRRAMDEPAA
ncbi:MAG: hypothetical protein R3E96_14460 [Planctomycetota bacterium]